MFVSRNFNRLLCDCNNKFNLMKYSINQKEKLKDRVGFIGDGAMAKAICGSLVRSGLIGYDQVSVSSPYMKNLIPWRDLGAKVHTDNAVCAAETNIIFLAVKPHTIEEALLHIVQHSKETKIENKIFVSVAAGVSIKSIENLTSQLENCRVIRVMPNTPMIVNEGCSVYCPGTTATKEDTDLIQKLLSTAGHAAELPEYLINPAGALTASGVAFACLFMEALADGGVRMGLHRQMASELAAATVLGAAKLALNGSQHVAALKDDVCSAGGQTIAGIHELERGAFRGAVMNAMEKTTLKAIDLAKGEKPGQD